jgi:hypothetical protein
MTGQGTSTHRESERKQAHIIGRQYDTMGFGWGKAQTKGRIQWNATLLVPPFKQHTHDIYISPSMAIPHAPRAPRQPQNTPHTTQKKPTHRTRCIRSSMSQPWACAYANGVRGSRSGKKCSAPLRFPPPLAAPWWAKGGVVCLYGACDLGRWARHLYESGKKTPHIQRLSTCSSLLHVRRESERETRGKQSDSHTRHLQLWLWHTHPPIHPTHPHHLQSTPTHPHTPPPNHLLLALVCVHVRKAQKEVLTHGSREQHGVLVCVYVCVYMYVYVCVCLYIEIRTVPENSTASESVCIHVYVCIYTCICVCGCV